MAYTRMTLDIDNIPYDSPSAVDEVRDIMTAILKLNDSCIWLEEFLTQSWSPGMDYRFRIVLGMEDDSGIEIVRKADLIHGARDEWVVEQVEE